MAYYDTQFLVKGDTLPQLNLIIRDSNTAASGATLDDSDSSTWAPIDLSGATVRLKFKALGSTAVKENLIFSVRNPVEGDVFLAWPAAALDTAGTFTGEIEVTYADGGIQTVYDQLKFKVREDY
jgi:hypothetical protein|tara:strand:+ start:140 stop:511 length:372 start_codon:yes stop_codon:yes gene_type:complete